MTEFLTWPTRQVWPLFLRDRTCSYSLTTVSYLSARGASHGSLETYPSMYAKVRGSIPGGLGKLRLGELVTDKTWREGSEMQVWEPPRRVENRFEGPKKKGGTRCTLNGQETKEVTATHSANVTTFCVAFKWNNRDALLCTFYVLLYFIIEHLNLKDQISYALFILQKMQYPRNLKLNHVME